MLLMVVVLIIVDCTRALFLQRWRYYVDLKTKSNTVSYTKNYFYFIYIYIISNTPRAAPDVMYPLLYRFCVLLWGLLCTRRPKNVRLPVKKTKSYIHAHAYYNNYFRFECTFRTCFCVCAGYVIDRERARERDKSVFGCCYGFKTRWCGLLGWECLCYLRAV